jgi:glyoxylase-like metal-dependent hydrolase (beta-lactamase superfamily II)
MLEELGLVSVRIDLPFRLDHVNCFMAVGENGWTVIDTGLHDDRTVARWDERLQGKKVTDLFITHYHPDHFGYAGGMQQKTGASVSMTKVDADDGMKVWESDFIKEIRRNYILAGVPEQTAVNMTSNTESFTARVTPYPQINHYFEEGEKVHIGPYAYEVIFTPGHSDGLVVFYCKEKNVLLSTDHILPRITPNIAYWFHGIENPLQAYMDALNKVKKLDADLVIPSHGKPFHGANERIDEILGHHDRRLDKTLDSVGNGATIYEVCGKLFDRELNVHETRFALGETIAHLEYLRHNGEVEREMKDGVWRYSSKLL